MRRIGQSGHQTSNDEFRILAWPAWNTGNPHVQSLADGMVAQNHRVEVVEFDIRKDWLGRPDVVHINWPEMAAEQSSLISAGVKSTLMVLHLLIWRILAVPVVWTVHNLGSHERRHPWLERWVKRTLLVACRGSIHLSRAGRVQAELVHPQLAKWPSIVAPLPAVAACEYVAKDPAAIQLVSFGRIRPYKNIPHLLESFASLDTDAPVRLTIAGYCDDPDIIRRMAEHQDDPRVEIDTKWLTDTEIKALVARAHAVILPHRALFNSGVAVDALALGAPTAVTRSAATEELAESVGPEWMRLLSPELTIEELEATVEWARSPRTGAAPMPDRDPDLIAREMLDFFIHVARPS